MPSEILPIVTQSRHTFYCHHLAIAIISNSVQIRRMMCALWMFVLLCLPPQGEGIMQWWPLSVRLSVPCFILSRELAGGKPMTRVTLDTIYGSKVKVTRLINAETKNQPYLRNRKPYKLQWVQGHASLTCTVTSKVKGQGYNMTLSVGHICP